VLHRTNAVWDNRISALEITFGVLQHGQGDADRKLSPLFLRLTLCAAPEYQLKLRSVRGKKSGGVLVVRAREADVAQSATAALHESHLAGQYLQGTLDNTETGSSLIDLIPSLGPFLDIADKIATVCEMWQLRCLLFNDIVAAASLRQHRLESHLFGDPGQDDLHVFPRVQTRVSSLQIPRAQIQRDDDVVKLITQMEELYSFVTAVDKLKQVPILENTLQAILNQSVECAFFLRGYISRTFGGECVEEFPINRS
jgi:hypothetical protein